MSSGGPPLKKPPYQQDFSIPKQMQQAMGLAIFLREIGPPPESGAGAVPGQEVTMPPRGRTLWPARRGDSSPRPFRPWPFRPGCSLPLGSTKGLDDPGGTHCLLGRFSRPRKLILNKLILEGVCKKGKDAEGFGRETRSAYHRFKPLSQRLPACKPFRANPFSQSTSSAKEVSEEDRKI